MIITWKIENIAAILNPDEIAARQASGPVVVQVGWQVTATDRIYRGSVSGQQQFTYDPETDFTPYHQLTEAQVLGWVHGAMGDQKQAFEDMATQQIEQQKASPITLPLPWHQPKPVIVEPPSGNDTLFGGNSNDSLGGL
jgi:hypothetical protein